MGRFSVLAVLSSSVVICTLGAAGTGAQYDIQATTIKTGGTLASDEVWTAVASPYQLTGSLTIPDKRTLTIEPGVTVYLASGVNITVADGGRILAEGTETQGIRFTRLPGSSASWGGITINGAGDSPETRMAYASLEGNGNTCIQVTGGTLYLDHATFVTTTHRYLSLDGSSFLVSHCHFPTATASFEMVKGTGSIKSGGRGIVRDSFFGRAKGHSDALDFAGGHRDLNQPILQVYNNVFVGSDDDLMDIDGTDAWVEGNIIVDAEQLLRNYDAKQTTVTWNNNILPMAWDGPGSGNTIIDPMLKHVPQVSETQFTSWDDAQVMREWFSLQGGSPAHGTGPNGMDKGGVIPLGVSISGEPLGTTSKADATLIVGVNRTGSGIPTAGFPLGSGFTYYRWRLDASAWSAETPIATPIKLTNLAQGSHHVDVIGKNDAGLYQNDAALGTDAVVTASRTWAVDRTHSRLQINEVLAGSISTVISGDSRPGMIELYYDGPSSKDLSGRRITNDPARPTRFVFPTGTKMTPGQYLVLFADGNTAPSGIHLGFALAAEGDGVYLYDKSGTLVDSVEFGRQLPDLSIGRIGYDDEWTLTAPTVGQANLAVGLGSPDSLVINEWLTNGQVLFTEGFIELYDLSADPVNLGGMYLTDGPATAPAASKIKPLSFMGGNGYAVFLADKSNARGHARVELQGR
jgi:hypothetical protein